MDFAHHVIEDSTSAARLSYAGPQNASKLAGVLQGFGECRNLDADSIGALLAQPSEDARDAMRRRNLAY